MWVLTDIIIDDSHMGAWQSSDYSGNLSRATCIIKLRPHARQADEAKDKVLVVFADSLSALIIV